MATRSTIALLRENGEVIQTYCHWDGYLEHNGRLLTEFFDTPEKVEELLSYGQISSLGEKIGEKHPFSAYGKPLTLDEQELLERSKTEQWTTFYGRDRGEIGVGANVYSDLGIYESEYQPEEYNYLFMYGDWYYQTCGAPEKVTEGLAKL